MGYREDRRQNVSDLKNWYRETPSRAAWLKVNGKSSEAMKTGTAVHELLEHRGEVPDHYVLSPHATYQSKVAKEWKREQESAGKVPFKEAEFSKIRNMVQAVWIKCPDFVKQAIQSTDSMREREVYTDTSKQLQDLFLDGIIFDYKKTAAKSPEAFAKDAEKFDYDMQAAWYLDNDDTANAFYFIAVCDSEPHEVWCFDCSPEFLDRGRMKIEIAQKNKEDYYREGEKEPELYTLHPPAWAQQPTENAASVFDEEI
jgi:hypothetical protein